MFGTMIDFGLLMLSWSCMRDLFLPVNIIAIDYIWVFGNTFIMEVAFKKKWSDLSVKYIYDKIKFIKQKQFKKKQQKMWLWNDINIFRSANEIRETG